MDFMLWGSCPQRGKIGFCWLPYNVRVAIFRSANYGLPQKRERVYIIMSRNDEVSPAQMDI